MTDSKFDSKGYRKDEMPDMEDLIEKQVERELQVLREEGEVLSECFIKIIRDKVRSEFKIAHIKGEIAAQAYKNRILDLEFEKLEEARRIQQIIWRSDNIIEFPDMEWRRKK
jgi:hypothetical protein